MPVDQNTDTLLVLEGMGIPRWAARGLRESFRPIAAAAQFSRSINGQSMNLSQTQFRKYDLTVTCTDHRTPAFDGVWPGAEVTIDCVTELAYPLYGSPGRAVVEGSERQEGDWIWYRPRLQCHFLGFTDDTEEWEGRVAWEANFTEI